MALSRGQLVRCAPIEFVFRLLGDGWVGVVVAGAAVSCVAGRSVGDDGDAGRRDLAGESGTERAGDGDETRDEPDRVLGGVGAHGEPRWLVGN